MMMLEEVLKRVNIVCRVVFNDEDLVVEKETNANNIEAWDSITNLFLIDSIEKEFGIKFTLDEIFNARNIGDLCEVIRDKIS